MYLKSVMSVTLKYITVDFIVYIFFYELFL